MGGPTVRSLRARREPIGGSNGARIVRGQAVAAPGLVVPVPLRAVVAAFQDQHPRVIRDRGDDDTGGDQDVGLELEQPSDSDAVADPSDLWYAQSTEVEASRVTSPVFCKGAPCSAQVGSSQQRIHQGMLASRAKAERADPSE